MDAAAGTPEGDRLDLLARGDHLADGLLGGTDAGAHQHDHFLSISGTDVIESLHLWNQETDGKKQERAFSGSRRR